MYSKIVSNIYLFCNVNVLTARIKRSYSEVEGGIPSNNGMDVCEDA